MRALIDSAVEFLLLLGLWMMFASLLHWNEVLAGVAAALIGAVGDAVVKATGFATFRPQVRQALQVLRLPGEVLQNTLVVFAELLRRMLGRPSRSRLQVVPFDAGRDDTESAARRALATLYTTIPPNSVVVGIDQERHYLLLHSLVPAPVSPVTRRLGAKP
ncbi:MAG TPA: Na+/H+ antiporter subunit E [Terriglobales bacterium]|nr:Na+/H+ antiporter subunit E [Terriglobales bacterium]